MKRLISILLVTVLLLSAVCGCNSNKDEKTTSTVSDNVSSTESTVSDNIESTESDVESEDENIVSTTTPLDTPSEEDASSSETSSSSDKEEDEGELPIGHRIKGGINFEELQSDGMPTFDEYVYDKSYWELVAEAGFDNVRLPVRLDAYVIGEAPEYEMDQQALRWLDIAINNCLSSRLVVILDYHHSCYKDEPEKFKKVWEQTSTRYQDYPEELFFEIVNEPNGVSHDYLNVLQMETYRIIRKTNPTRTIAFATNWFNSAAALEYTVIPGPEVDPNIIVSIHNYAPMSYSHAGMGGKHGSAKADFDPAWEKTITNAVAELAGYEKMHGIPIWVSEWGAYQGGGNFFKEDSSVYYSWWTKAFAKYDIAYAVWEFNHGFGVFDWKEQKWKKYLLDNMVIQW